MYREEYMGKRQNILVHYGINEKLSGEINKL